MTKCERACNTPETFINDLIGFHAFFLAVIRFAVEKYGGTMCTDLSSGATRVHIPDWAEEICLHDLGQLVGPGRPLNAYLPFLGG